MKSYIYAIPLIIILLAIGVNAYSYKIPLCSATNSTGCLNTSTTTGISGTPAVIFYQDGNFYLTNEIGYNFTNSYYNVTNVTYLNASYFNVTNISYINMTNLTYQNVSYITYHINNSNGSSYTIQNNVTFDKSYVKKLFDELYDNLNSTSYYNKTQSDSLYISQTQLNNALTNLANYATKGELVNLENRLSFNNLNLSSLNITRVNEHMDNVGDFNTTWKTVVIIEGIVIVLLLLFVAKSMMSGDY